MYILKKLKWDYTLPTLPNVPFFFLAALGLRCCVWALSSGSERGLLFVAVHGLFIAVASLVVEHRL